MQTRMPLKPRWSFVARYGFGQELQPPKSVPARFELEPAMIQLSIMADVYMAAGRSKQLSLYYTTLACV